MMNGHQHRRTALGGAVLTALLAGCAGPAAHPAQAVRPARAASRPAPVQPERLAFPGTLLEFDTMTSNAGDIRLATTLGGLFPGLRGSEQRAEYVTSDAPTGDVIAAARVGTTALTGDPAALADKALHAFAGTPPLLTVTIGPSQPARAPDSHTAVRCVVSQFNMNGGAVPGPAVCAWADQWSVGVLVDFLGWKEQQPDSVLRGLAAQRIDALLTAARHTS
jgi:hypothetical protein